MLQLKPKLQKGGFSPEIQSPVQMLWRKGKIKLTPVPFFLPKLSQSVFYGFMCRLFFILGGV